MTEQESPPSHSSRIRKTGTVVLIMFPVIALFIWAGLSLSAERRQRGHEFVEALREEQFDKALRMCSEDLRQHIKDVETLRRATKPELIPDSFWWSEVKSTGGETFLRSSMKTWWGGYSVTIRLKLEDGEHRVVTMSAANTSGRMELSAPRNP